MKSVFQWCLIAVPLLLATACGELERNPLSPTETDYPSVPGIENARYWGDAPPPNLDEILANTLAQRRASGVARNGREVLVLSGGAEQGAYAAGLLKAWSESGARPEFSTVSGVSTGALIAPFAFLGEDYDQALKKFYGGTPADQIVRMRSAVETLFSVSAADSAPLRRIIDNTVTPEFLGKIAHEHNRGRRLIIQSLSLDAQRPVIWDLGAIAASGAPNAEQVFQDAILASASIPGVFPPVLVDVQTPEGVRDELHVDGAIYSSATGLEAWYIRDPRRELPNQRETLYLIRNVKVIPEPKVTQAKLIPIAARSLDTLVKTQGTDDLLEIYLGTKDSGGQYKVSWIGSGFEEEMDEPFDPKFMAALYQYGYEKFQSGNVWSNLPPQLMSREKVSSIH